MKRYLAQIERTSDMCINKPRVFKEFSTIEELLEYCKAVENELIISVDKYNFDHPAIDFKIEIYDDYRE